MHLARFGQTHAGVGTHLSLALHQPAALERRVRPFPGLDALAQGLVTRADLIEIFRPCFSRREQPRGMQDPFLIQIVTTHGVPPRLHSTRQPFRQQLA